MSTAEHLPSGWPFESSHYKTTFRTPQLGYCRYNVQPSSVHRKNNPHAALTDPWQYPNKVTYLHVTEVFGGSGAFNRQGKGGGGGGGLGDHVAHKIKWSFYVLFTKTTEIY